MKSGFDCPVCGFIIPKNYTLKKDNDGFIYIVPPKDAKVPSELKPYVKEK